MDTRWHRDPVVAAATVVGVLACAYVVFAGRYLPYQDWAGHVGLSAVLAYGDASGADAYLTRSLVPTPYYLFYVTTAALGFVMPIEAAAKVNLLIASAVATLGAARLAAATGRSPRLCGVAPLVIFGLSLGFGFASFVVGLPWILHALADTERLYGRPDDAAARRWAAIRLAIWLSFCFLGHGLVFLFAAMAIGLRSAVHVARRPREFQPVLYAVAAGAAVGLIAAPSVIRRLQHRYVSPEFMTPNGVGLSGFIPWSQRTKSLAADLLDRGGEGHMTTMMLVVGWAAILVLVRVLRGRHDDRPQREGLQDGLPLYAVIMTVVFLFGPVWIGWPVTFWVVAQRAGTLAGAARDPVRSCQPDGHDRRDHCELGDRSGRGTTRWSTARLSSATARGPGLTTTCAHRFHSDNEFSRFTIPRRGSPGTTLYFLHLVDGAAYVPIGNIPEEVPVHRRNVPGTPYNPDARSFAPRPARSDVRLHCSPR